MEIIFFLSYCHSVVSKNRSHAPAVQTSIAKGNNLQKRKTFHADNKWNWKLKKIIRKNKKNVWLVHFMVVGTHLYNLTLAFYDCGSFTLCAEKKAGKTPKSCCCCCCFFFVYIFTWCCIAKEQYIEEMFVSKFWTTDTNVTEWLFSWLEHVFAISWININKNIVRKYYNKTKIQTSWTLFFGNTYLTPQWVQVCSVLCPET